jgi:hypothetical protein
MAIFFVHFASFVDRSLAEMENHFFPLAPADANPFRPKKPYFSAPPFQPRGTIRRAGKTRHFLASSGSKKPQKPPKICPKGPYAGKELGFGGARFVAHQPEPLADKRRGSD